MEWDWDYSDYTSELPGPDGLQVWQRDWLSSTSTQTLSGRMPIVPDSGS